MGFRFQKSVKIFPGVRINIGSKSVGISIGNKSGGISFNTKTGTHVRASVPGTGISYTEKIGRNQADSKGKKIEGENIFLQEAQNYVRIIRESAQICKDTTDPETFFSRLELLAETARKLCNMREKVSINPQIIEATDRLDGDENIHILDFINRFFANQYENSLKLKTPKGRLNRLQKSYETLMKYQDKMDELCLRHALNVYENYVQMGNMAGEITD